MKPQLKVVDRGWKRLSKLYRKTVPGVASQVGIQGPEAFAVAPDHGDMTNIYLGSIHEFGTKDKRIPERPFMRQTFDKHSARYQRELEKIAKDFFGGIPADPYVRMLGEDYRDDIVQAIASRQFREWKESTRLRKEMEGKSGDVPLWDTGQLKDSITVVMMEGV